MPSRIGFRRTKNLKDILVHADMTSENQPQPSQIKGHFKCGRCAICSLTIEQKEITIPNTNKMLQEQCEADLAEAMPVLEDALLALDMLNPANTSFLKVQSERKKGITQKKEHGNNPEVAVMPMELTALHSEQIQTSAEMEKTVTLLEKETIEVSDAKEQLVGADEKEANEVAALAKVIQEQCEGDLAEAMPALKTALLAPNMLNPANTSFLKVQSERKKGITQKKEHWNNPEVCYLKPEGAEKLQSGLGGEKARGTEEEEFEQVSKEPMSLVLFAH
ncbi:dynein axonemal heavy chain 3-like [Zootoca vivipara]|uniref:dynein axonemal heavy chain 3-like n=1 Tax=Zootoca vivipara TaxID=8524 RepID=UPI00293BC576|nr:dynein axonemal heavy chain 3-like [Zootoca vivipara]